MIFIVSRLSLMAVAIFLISPPSRRLTLLQLDGLAGGLPAPGDVVRLGERPVGAVTSVARHHELGPIALALLRRGVPAEAALSVDVSEAAGPPAGRRSRPGAGRRRW